MPLYHLLLDAAAFRGRIRPCLAESWRRRSFGPCRDLCADLLPAARAFAERYHLAGEAPLLAAAAGGSLPFDRDFWRALAGEVIWFGAAGIPEIENILDPLCRLLGVEPPIAAPPARAAAAPAVQAYWGARDLTFGAAFYRPEDAGWCDTDDVTRLAGFLQGIDADAWTPDLLAGMPGLAAEDRGEELQYVREWFPALRDLYRGAADAGQVVVCEFVQPRRDD